MSIKDAFLSNLFSDTHLRDARHANQIYAQNNFAFSPKTKYMYHVRFEPNEEVGNSTTSNVFKYQKELGVLVKSADLPSFRASVENKQQYNRKKNVQTRVDYQDCRISFHDDNTGVTRALLEEYYRYYFVDGNKNTTGADGAYQPRDKYFKKVPNYGMNNDKRNPFFKYITIYQLAKREWVAYTLINPLLSAWDHGSVESSSTEFNENTITVAYEGVTYTSGNVGQDTPAGFADESVGYDIEPSPLGYLDDAMNGNVDLGKGLVPTLIGLGTTEILNRTFGNTDRNSSNILKDVATGVATGVIGNILSQSKLPVADSQNRNTPVQSQSNNSSLLSVNDISGYLSNSAIASAVYPALVNSNLADDVSINDYNNASAAQKSNYNSQIDSKIASGDQKAVSVASNSIKQVLGK